MVIGLLIKIKFYIQYRYYLYLKLIKEGDIINKDFDLNTYNPFEKTAIKRSILSAPMKILYNKKLLNGSCLDVATGYGLDVKHLKGLGIHIEGYDAFNSEFNNEELLNNTYDTLTNIYMFNTIADLHEHNFQLARLKELGDNKIYIAVRSDERAINPQTWRFINEYDGWITSNNSFQRFYTTNEMIERYFGEVTYIHNGKDFKLFKLNI